MTDIVNKSNLRGCFIVIGWDKKGETGERSNKEGSTALSSNYINHHNVPIFFIFSNKLSVSIRWNSK